MAEAFDKLVQDIHACRRCQERFGFEPNPVFSGNEHAKILQVSQAPSLTVHRTNKCFNDASGRKLRGEWYNITDEMFYDDDNFYISGVGHCYPGRNRHGGDNRPPKICAELWLEKEVALVQCKLIILIGRLAANHFFPGKDFAELVFHDQIINSKLAIVLPHPSPLNRKWFKDHPEFEKKRIVEIRKHVHAVLFGLQS